MRAFVMVIGVFWILGMGLATGCVCLPCGGKRRGKKLFTSLPSRNDSKWRPYMETYERN